VNERILGAISSVPRATRSAGEEEDRHLNRLLFSSWEKQEYLYHIERSRLLTRRVGYARKWPESWQDRHDNWWEPFLA